MQKMHPCSCIAAFGAESQPNEFHFHATSSMVPVQSANRHHSNQTARIWSTVEIHTDRAPTCATKALLCEAYLAVTVINRHKLLQLKFWHPKNKNISINSVVGRWCFTNILVETPVFTVTKTSNWNLWAFRSISNERSYLCSSHPWMSINLFLFSGLLMRFFKYSLMVSIASWENSWITGTVMEIKPRKISHVLICPHNPNPSANTWIHETIICYLLLLRCSTYRIGQLGILHLPHKQFRWKEWGVFWTVCYKKAVVICILVAQSIIEYHFLDKLIGLNRIWMEPFVTSHIWSLFTPTPSLIIESYSSA